MDSDQQSRIEHPEIDLFDLVRAGWRGRLVIVAGSFAFGAVALLANLLMEPVYEASVMMMVSELEPGREPTAPSTEQFTALIENRSVAAEVTEQLGLSEPPYNIAPLRFVANHLDATVIPGTSLVQATVLLSDPEMAARAANLVAERTIALTRRMVQRDTRSASDLIRAQLDEATTYLAGARDSLLEFRRAARIELARQDATILLARVERLDAELFNVQSRVNRQDFDQAGARLLAAQDAELEFRRNGQIEQTRQALQAALAEGTRLDARRTDVVIEIGRAQALLDRAAVEMAEQPALLETVRSIEADPVLVEVARSRGRPLDELLQLTFRSEILNPIHQVLDELVVTTRANLAGLQEQLREIEAGLEDSATRVGELEAQVAENDSRLRALADAHTLARNEYLALFETSAASNAAQVDLITEARRETLAELEVLQRRLYELEIQDQALTLEVAQAQSIHSDLTTRYEQTRMQLASEVSPLQIIDPAMSDPLPRWPQRRLNVILGILIGFTLSYFGVLIREFGNGGLASA